jgi:hypothetical protein
MAKFTDRTGEKYITNQGYEIEIVKYLNKSNCIIKFQDGLELFKKDYRHIKEGFIKNPNHKSVFNIGYLGVGDYSTKDNSYVHWQGMLRRGYDKKHKKEYLSYESCFVANEWHNFQNFSEWFYKNYDLETLENWQLDKDILVKGNKIYSPETCCLVPSEVNILFAKRKAKRGSYPIGVTLHGKKYAASISKNNKLIHLGVFNTSEEAFKVYKTAKEDWIKEVADKWQQFIEPKVYQAMYNYQVEITD